MVGLSSSSQIWEKLHTYYASLPVKGKNQEAQGSTRTPRHDRTFIVYILDTKKIVDTLGAIGAPISKEEHIEVLLDGLSEEYETFITAAILPIYN